MSGPCDTSQIVGENSKKWVSDNCTDVTELLESLAKHTQNVNDAISEYNQIPNKTTKGKPSQYMIDRQYTPVIYFWNVPDKAYTLNYWAMNQLDDITASNQDADIPYRWSDCICAGLASKLSMKYAPEKFQLLNEMYERAFNHAASSDNDGVSLRVQPTVLNLV